MWQINNNKVSMDLDPKIIEICLSIIISFVK